MAGEKPAGSLNRHTHHTDPAGGMTPAGGLAKKVVLVATRFTGSISSITGSLVTKAKKALAGAISSIVGALTSIWRHPVILTAIPRNTTLNTRERDVTLQAVVRKTSLTTIVREREKN